MKMLTLANRNMKEIVRDPLNLGFGLGFPLVLLLLLSAIQASIPVSLFEIESLTPGITVFGLSFMTLFSATLLAKDRGSALLQRLYIEQIIRLAYEEGAEDDERSYARDFFWYLWCGPDSPLFDKSKMTTFERYFINNKEVHIEEKGWYFKLRDREDVCERLLDDFEVDGKYRHIINGHVPVKVGKGENPIKAGGRLMVIDGGFARAYHSTTGIAGYTLVYHSRGFQLVQHAPFTSTEEAVREGIDIQSTTSIVETSNRRVLVADTDIGRELRKQIAELELLLRAYRKGWLKEN